MLYFKRSSNVKFDTNNMLKLLVYSSLLAPASIKKAFEWISVLIANVYCSLSFSTKQLYMVILF